MQLSRTTTRVAHQCSQRVKHVPAAAGLSSCRRTASRVVAVRVAGPDQDNIETPSMQIAFERFVQRYEHSMVSAGVGAAAVTTWCVAHGQAPGTAAAITVASTITALVLNELLFADQQ